jgi:predicted kinase
MSEFERLLKEGKSVIVVDNTNIKNKDRQYYIDKAEEYNYKSEIVLPDSPWFLDILPRLREQTFTDDDVQVFFEKNSHDVPFEVIKNMMSNWKE